MPNIKNNRTSPIENQRRGKLPEKSSSFYGQNSATAASVKIRRPKTMPELLPDRNRAAMTTAAEIFPRVPPKLLLKVTTMGSLGPVQVLMTPESTVGDLITAAVQLYVKEGRRPILPSNEGSCFDLHYSQFSLESLDRNVKLREIGSRNFFMCPKNSIGENENGGDDSVTTSFGSCSTQAEKPCKGFGWLSKVYSFLQ
ncbi:hypothetical protein TSUD_98290 [Trifolium subterraneum]|uniref:DUF7054 domain-containing protein n=1 Tax=Trifolium subterraneum TaxID=3900 RepID=A0A2Z6MHZ4_TRISU|nr:hypothetical protein TSUD_98290 [Trifolium subterraneum]